MLLQYNRIMITASRLFELLAADHCRQILFLLCSTDSLDISEGLSTRGATQVQQPEASDSQSPSAQQSSPRDSTWREEALELRHVHLPKLADEDIIEWDPTADTISHGDAFEEIEPALRVLASNSTVFPDGLF